MLIFCRFFDWSCIVPLWIITYEKPFHHSLSFNTPQTAKDKEKTQPMLIIRIIWWWICEASPNKFAWLYMQIDTIFCYNQKEKTRVQLKQNHSHKDLGSTSFIHSYHITESSIELWQLKKILNTPLSSISMWHEQWIYTCS